jgi:hypothetical protein
MATLYVRQDGADFYIYTDEENDELVRAQSAPFRVQDFDMWWAAHARSWFTAQVTRAGDTVKWLGP